MRFDMPNSPRRGAARASLVFAAALFAASLVVLYQGSSHHNGASSHSERYELGHGWALRVHVQGAAAATARLPSEVWAGGPAPVPVNSSDVLALLTDAEKKELEALSGRPDRGGMLLHRAALTPWRTACARSRHPQLMHLAGRCLLHQFSLLMSFGTADRVFIATGDIPDM